MRSVLVMGRFFDDRVWYETSIVMSDECIRGVLVSVFVVFFFFFFSSACQDGIYIATFLVSCRCLDIPCCIFRVVTWSVASAGLPRSKGGVWTNQRQWIYLRILWMQRDGPAASLEICRRTHMLLTQNKDNKIGCSSACKGFFRRICLRISPSGLPARCAEEGSPGAGC